MKTVLPLVLWLLGSQTIWPAASCLPGRLIVSPSAEFPRNGECSMITLKTGEILLLYGAQAGTGDWTIGVIREIRSADNGQTWSEPRTLFTDLSRSLFQPSLARLANGDIGLTHTSLWPKRGAFKVFRRSTDEGRTWSEPVRISDDSWPYTTGPWDKLYTLSNGRVVALLHCMLRKDVSKQGGPHGVYVVFSDDHGHTWRRSPPNDVLTVTENPYQHSEWGFWEPSLVEYQPGKLLMLARTSTGWLYESRSEDNGTTWSAPMRSPVPNPVAPPVLTKIPGSDTLLLLHNPRVAMTTERLGGHRTILAYRTSRDAGRSWSEPRTIIESKDAQHWFDYPAILWRSNELHLACRRIGIVNSNKWTGVGIWHHTLRFAPLPGGHDDKGTTRFSVLDFGAVPDDGRDDGPAVRAAIAACRKAARPCLIFPPGAYHFRAESAKTDALIEFNNLLEITVRGEKATLIGNSHKTLFRFENCGEVTVSGFEVDWDPLPFTAGRVVAARDDSIDIEIVPPHPLRGDSPVQSLITFDPEVRIPLPSSHPHYYQLTQKAYSKEAEIIGDKLLRIYITPKPETLRSRKQQRIPAVGSYVLALYRVRGGSAFRPFGCGNVRFENVTVHAVLGMGFAMNSCDRVSLRNCRVAIKPGSGRWMSSTVDATHCNMIRQRIEYTDCLFEGMGDDAINVHGMYAMVQERLDNRTIVLRGWKSIFDTPFLKDDFASTARNSHRPGDTLEFGTPDNPLVPAFRARIFETAPVVVKGVTLKRLRLDRDLPDFVQAGSIVANASEIPECLIRNCTVRGGRGCGVRLKTRNAVVENCTFERVHGAGIWITCDADVDHESIAARNVTIRNNVFRHISPAISVSAGRKKLYPDVHENLLITGNRIEAAPRAAISIRSTKDAVVRDNIISSAGAEPIEVSLSSNVRVENNQITRWTNQPTMNNRIVAAFAFVATLSAAHAAPFLEKIDLFESGTDGYALYRIPGITVTKKGTVLAWCEARKTGKGDWGPIDVMMRRSTDGGKTWLPRQCIVHVEGELPVNPVAAAQKLDKPGDNTANNPVAIADLETGAVHFLYCLEYMRCFYMRSDDEGATWSKPVEITATFEQFRKDYDWKVIATGPAHGIQLTHGPHKGRRVVPIWMSLGTGGHAHRPSVTSTIYSDDHGKTWKRGEIAIPGKPPFRYPNETVAVQLANGNVLLNARSESDAHRRIQTTSKDGATGWTRPVFNQQLLEPICMGSIVRFSRKPNHDKNRILFANPHNLERADGKAKEGVSRDRKNLSIKLSYDECKTWPVNKSLEPGYSAYSDLAVLSDGTILCFYERGRASDATAKKPTSYAYLTLARFNLEWLTDGKDVPALDQRSNYGAKRHNFEVAGCEAFVIHPFKPAPGGAKPWVWYAPAIGHNPSAANAWLLSKLLSNGFYVAGINVGETFANPQSRKQFAAFYRHATKTYGLSPKVCLLAQSRGGLNHYNFAADHPDWIACIAGIYTVGDLRSFPGLQRAAPMYQLSEAELEAQLAKHNPIERLAPIAKAKIPILHIHGDSDKVVPIEKNSQAIHDRYRALGGPMELIVVPGQGHNFHTAFFESEAMLAFIIKHGIGQ